MASKYITLGYSGHSYVVIEAVRASGGEVVGYMDRSELQKNPYELRYLGDDSDDTAEAWLGDYLFVPAMGDNRIRRFVCENVMRRAASLGTVYHPHSTVSESSTIGVGSVVFARAVINARASVGQGSIINTGAIIEHECSIGAYVHVAPGAVLAGNVSVGENSFIGANAVVRQGIHIGKDVVIGAGAVVVNNIEDGVLVVGNPGRKRNG